MAKKIKWNYAVVRSIFGDFWVGKTKLKADEITIFGDKEDVIKQIEEQFLDEHIDFDPDLDEDDENYNDELFYKFEEIREHAEEPDEITKGMEKFIVKL
jgi:hypothetical protein